MCKRHSVALAGQEGAVCKWVWERVSGTLGLLRVLAYVILIKVNLKTLKRSVLWRREHGDEMEMNWGKGCQIVLTPRKGQHERDA